jgi:iron complex outermembrane recepter protein
MIALDRFANAAILAAGLLTSPAAAQDSAPDQHAEDSQNEIVVTGRMIAGGGDAIHAPVVLQGEALTRDLRGQIGAMLEKLPGVSASGFAPGASRPVLRGFDGPRVQVLIDGLGSLDASSVSADHAVSLDTLTIDRVEVLHGPQVLLYASDPSGGVVNARDKRIPRRVPDAPLKFDAIASYGSAASAVTAGGAADWRIAPRLVAHVDAGYGRSEDLRIGGHVLSPSLRTRTRAEAAVLRAAGDRIGAAELDVQADARGRLENSWTRQHSLGAGLAFLDDGGEIGVSAARLSSDYGIPLRPGVGREPVSIGLDQTRFDMRAALMPQGLFERVELRAAWGDYHHTEFEDGSPATRFLSKGIEARLDLTQAKRGAWSGVSGVQYGSRRQDVRGNETLLPDSTTDRVAGFTLQRLTLGSVDLEAGGRLERTSLRAGPDHAKRQFGLWSAVGGVAWHLVDPVTLSLAVSRGERAPSAEELFIDGIHEATQSYERGDPGFTTERSTGVEAGLRYQSPGLSLSVTAFATRYAGFIAAVPTGAEIEDFPVYQFIQAGARYRGLEVETSARAFEWGEHSLTVEASGDLTRAALKGIGPAPRIPPLRLRGGVEYGSPALTLRGEIEWNARQPRVAANEAPTGAFALLGASATWHPLGEEGALTLILSADNLLDVTGRRAVSETRDFVPVAGRDIRITARIAI